MKILKVCGKILLILLVILFVIMVAVLLFLKFYPSIGTTPDSEMQESFSQKTELFYDGQFHNENEFSVMTGDVQRTSDRVSPKEMIPSEKSRNIERGEKGSLSITWYGHSSALIQLGNQNIFIDPVLSERSSPVGFAGPKRFSEIGLALDDVPDIDVIFISHDHYDHLDYKTITAIDEKVQHYIVPLGVDSYLIGWGIDESKLHPLNWWESIELNGVTYTLVPSRHYTGRNPLKLNISLWGGVHLADRDHSVYYTGDGGYYDVFSRVYECFGAVDLMLADSGQYDPGWAATHMNPSEAVQAAKDAQARWFIPVHWGAFVLANHAWDEPPAVASEVAEQLGVNIATPRIGEKVDYDQIALFTEHWWEEIETEEQNAMKMNVQIGNYTFTATLEDNAAVEELLDMMKEGPVTIQMDDYAGFEKVGALGTSLTTSNRQTTTAAGDIVLYNGNNIVMFYGSNSWSYTRIGKIDDLSDWEKALGSGSITAVFTLDE